MAHGVGQHFIGGLQQAQQLGAGERSNALADLALEQRRQGIDITQQKQGVSVELQKIKFMNNAGRALLQMPQNQRAAAFQRLEPLAEKVGIQRGTFTADQLTDENLQQLVQATSQLIQNPQELTAKLQEQASDFKILEGAVDENGQLKENLTAEQQAIATKLGLIARPVGSAAITTATTPGLTNIVAESEEIITGAKKTGELIAQLGLEPQVKSAVVTAVAQAEQVAKLAETGRSNEIAFRVYTTGMKGLIDGLAGTDTGPFVGWLPALTANQQIADGAVAALAPVLKQLFRSAGEGIFTDKDQELLLAMIPTRTDREAARTAKLNNVDAIVRAKLNIGQQPAQAQQTVETTQQPQVAQPAQQPAQFNSTALGRVVTEQEIQETLQANPGLTREQLFQQLGIQ